VLETAIHQAASNEAKALAYYNLGLFHDNNSRESEAIPTYKQAIEYGLDVHMRAQGLAWLASSLYKTDNLRAALERIAEAKTVSESAGLDKFLARLEKRVRRAI